MPSSAIASTTSGWTRSAGVVPAERASWRPSAARAKSASLICERPALWRQTKRARAIRPPRSRLARVLAADQLVGERAERGAEERGR